MVLQFLNNLILAPFDVELIHILSAILIMIHTETGANHVPAEDIHSRFNWERQRPGMDTES